MADEHPTCVCPVCGCVMFVPMFTGEQSAPCTCVSCKAPYRVLAANKQGKYHTVELEHQT